MRTNKKIRGLVVNKTVITIGLTIVLELLVKSFHLCFRTYTWDMMDRVDKWTKILDKLNFDIGCFQLLLFLFFMLQLIWMASILLDNIRTLTPKMFSKASYIMLRKGFQLMLLWWGLLIL